MSIFYAFQFSTFVTIQFSRITYLVWFWLISRHVVSRLAAFTFMAPIFGVILGGILLNEPLTFLVWLGLACVAGGVYMVNR